MSRLSKQYLSESPSQSLKARQKPHAVLSGEKLLPPQWWEWGEMWGGRRTPPKMGREEMVLGGVPEGPVMYGLYEGLLMKM